MIILGLEESSRPIVMCSTARQRLMLKDAKRQHGENCEACQANKDAASDKGLLVLEKWRELSLMLAFP